MRGAKIMKNNRTSNKSYLRIPCDKCKELLNNPLDMVIYNIESFMGDNVISELSFRHGCGKGCDDRNFKLSRHVQEGFKDLLEAWNKSPFNKINKK
jgi:hypothetical protein